MDRKIQGYLALIIWGLYVAFPFRIFLDEFFGEWILDLGVGSTFLVVFGTILFVMCSIFGIPLLIGDTYFKEHFKEEEKSE